MTGHGCARHYCALTCGRCTADASPADIAAQAAEDAAWTELQRCSAWWLGEFLNSAAGEVAGHRQQQTPEEEQDAEDTAGLSAAEILALKASPMLQSNVRPAHGCYSQGVREGLCSWPSSAASRQVVSAAHRPAGLLCCAVLTHLLRDSSRRPCCSDVLTA